MMTGPSSPFVAPPSFAWEVRCWLVGWLLNPFERLAGLVVKASALRVEDPGFESQARGSNPACDGIFFGVESYQ